MIKMLVLYFYTDFREKRCLKKQLMCWLFRYQQEQLYSKRLCTWISCRGFGKVKKCVHAHIQAYRDRQIVMGLLCYVIQTARLCVLIKFGAASCGSDLLCNWWQLCSCSISCHVCVSFPLSIINQIRNPDLQDALIAIKGGRIPPPGSLPSFEEIKDTLGFNHYYEEEKRYIATPAQSSYRSGEHILA